MSCILLVDDDADGSIALSRALKSAGFDQAIHLATNVEKGAELAKQFVPSVVVLDLSLDERLGVESGFAFLKDIAQILPNSRTIVLTGHGGKEHGVRALKLGAANFLEKPADVPHLLALVNDGIAQSELRQDLIKLQSEYANRELVGSSSVMQQLRKEIEFASKTTQPVLLSGETGTGKGVCAEIIHRLSARAQSKFVRYQPNFSSPDLVASELFGHRKGAFTGALADRVGLLRESHNGTLLLDEVDELPVEVQVTLLGVLQERRYRMVGSNVEEQSDFRLICASNRDLQRAIKDGKLRQDFYHRIAHQTITIPPLRERLEDLPELVTAFLKKVRERNQLHVFEASKEAVSRMQEYSWPGNVRELESATEGAAYRAQFRGDSTILSQDLGVMLADTGSLSPGLDFTSQVEAFKQKLVREAMERNSNNQAQAALSLKLDRSTFRRILNRDKNSD